MKMTPNLSIAESSNNECVSIGYDIAGKYYVLSKEQAVIHDGLFVSIEKKILLTIPQAEKLRDDLNNFFGHHKKYKD